MRFKIVARDFPEDTELICPPLSLRWGKQIEHLGFVKAGISAMLFVGESIANGDCVRGEQGKSLGSIGWGNAGMIAGGIVAWSLALGGLIAGVLNCTEIP